MRLKKISQHREQSRKLVKRLKYGKGNVINFEEFFRKKKEGWDGISRIFHVGTRCVCDTRCRIVLTY